MRCGGTKRIKERIGDGKKKGRRGKKIKMKGTEGFKDKERDRGG